MKLIWTKSTLPLSWMIRTATGEDCSHFAVQFESLGLILQSNLVGVHLSIQGDFFNQVEVVHEAIVHGIDESREASVCLEMMRGIAGRSYGFKALIYFAWREFLKRVFRRKLPEKNSWADSREFLCTMIYDKIPDDVIPTFPRLDYAAMVTPHMLFTEILSKEGSSLVRLS